MIDIRRAEVIAGWMKPLELRWLAEQAQSRHCIIEIGCFEGRSTRALADHAPGIVVAVDPWVYKFEYKKRSYAFFQKNLQDHIDSNKLRIVRARSEDCLGLVMEAIGAERPDMVFIDGNHNYETVRHDVELARHLLAPGGLLCGHDYQHRHLPGVTRAVDELCAPVQVAGSIWWTIHDGSSSHPSARG